MILNIPQLIPVTRYNSTTGQKGFDLVEKYQQHQNKTINAVTQTAGDNSTKLATTAFVGTAVNDAITALKASKVGSDSVVQKTSDYSATVAKIKAKHTMRALGITIKSEP